LKKQQAYLNNLYLIYVTYINGNIMSAKTEEFFNELKIAVESDKLILPTLPEVALKIRHYHKMHHFQHV